MKKIRKSGFILLVAVLTVSSICHQTSAASLANVEIRFDRLKTSSATTGTVCAKPAPGMGMETTVVVTYPTGYTLGAAATFTVSTTNNAWPPGATAWLGIGTSTNVTGQAVTFPSSDLTPGTLYCFNWINSAAVTTKSTATSSNMGSIATFTLGFAVDSSPFTTSTITDDQIAVSASVPQSFTFSLSANTDALGNLSSSAITSSPTPRVATINTNAAMGWAAWARDNNTGLTSASAGKTIASTTPGTNSTLTTGSEGYNMGITSVSGGGAGTITVATPFVGGTTGRGGGLTTSLTTVATSNGTATNHALTLTNNASVAGATPSGIDYNDTITLIAAGLF